MNSECASPVEQRGVKFGGNRWEWVIQTKQPAEHSDLSMLLPVAYVCVWIVCLQVHEFRCALP